MTTNSSCNKDLVSDTTSKTIVSTINVAIAFCIFQWHSKPAEHYPQVSTNSHCLLRIYDFKAENRAVIVASSLWSNNENRSIWSELNSFAESLFDKFPHLKPILSNCILIIHSGQFSYQLSWAETPRRDRFDTVSLVLNEKKEVEVDEESERAIDSTEIRELLNQIPLEPVPSLLKQLEHDNGWGGVVDEKQTKACFESENGIVLDRVRETGLVGW